LFEGRPDEGNHADPLLQSTYVSAIRTSTFTCQFIPLPCISQRYSRAVNLLGGDVDEKAEKLLIPVDLSEYPSNEEIASTLLSKVPKGVHNVLVDFISRLYAVYVDCQFT
jgi:hypothetical protein